MTLHIASLNSGSNGNCYYIGNDREAVLIDAGLSCRETEKRMRRLGLPLDRVKAIFISHEHDDHIRGLEVLSRRYRLPVYITDPTLEQCRFPPDPEMVKSFQAGEAVSIGGLSILAFSKAHDASDPYSFVVSSPTVRVGVFTDIGVVCDNLVAHFAQCHAAFLETNYDEEMLEKGRYPWPLKHRIRGGHGHLSNRQALELFTAYRPPFMSHLLLAHLSQDNNSPELAQALFEAQAGGATIIVASRHNESEVYAIDGSYRGAPGPDWNPAGKRRPVPEPPAALEPGIAPSAASRRKALNPAKPKPTAIQTSLF
ncbi:MAG TPA: MBL fold metallo-hydrolase [Puia sp.]|uniref:MBL fold metallo-hydrolase n=1 Tax=Puia sp. TaxID=2045100 RepID=UPI002B86B7A0|nr:MBL fold metallo-hydrolase [Puia sp.]HVU94754.1 MBL fold metallo-hydrolase [Puia sp.]